MLNLNLYKYINIIEYQKIINLLGNAGNQTSKSRTKHWVEKNDARGTYNTNSQIKFKTTKTKSNLCVDSDTCIVVKETKKITGTGIGAAAIRTDERNEEVIFKNFASFTDCISEINYT